MFLLRHGQSAFNLHFTRTHRDPGIVDPHLTDEGRSQAHAAALALAHVGITRILATPYTRALQTAAEVAPVLGAPVAITAAARERYAFTCDIGTARATLAQSWPQHDFSTIEEVWWPDTFEEEAAVIDRAGQFRSVMRADPEHARTLLISHWGFLLALTGRSLENGQWMEWSPAEPAPREIIWRH